MIRRLIRRHIPTIIAITTGWLVLFGYLFPTQPLSGIRDRLVEWAVIVAAFAFLLGLFNVAHVHGRRLFRSRQGKLHSLALLGAAAISAIVTISQGPSGDWTQRILKYGLNPLGASLAALVAFTLALAAFRLLRARRSMEAIGFTLIAIAALVTSTPPIGIERLSFFSSIREWLVNIFGMAGMRGLLLGVALGTLITALRVLIGAERPHSES